MSGRTTDPNLTEPTPMTDPAIAVDAARILLSTHAVLVRPEAPFTLTSGRVSPVYVDCRRLISFPIERRRLMDMAVTRLSEAGADSVDAVAGGETAGIAYAAWLAERLDRPMLYVRKKPKGFGRDARIEGTLDPLGGFEGRRVLLVEDMATDGGSKLSFVAALREAGAVVQDCFVIFRYGVFPEGEAALAEAGVRLHGLATWADVLAAAEADGTLSADAVAQARDFLGDPDAWSRAHGGT